ncbi:RNA polymerase sigma factor, partial [Bacteroides heparinolyticus]
MEEALLITRLRNGSYSAFNTLYRMYAKRLYAYCLQFTKSAEESCDIVQETFVKLWENRNKLQDCPSIRPLLFAIAKND